MSTGPELEAFAYAEHLEGQRSLGFRLLIPEVSPSWAAEVETLARRLQAAPYPDHWSVTDLFCSVILASGHRLVALARYGMEDRTPSRRRGGVELIGVVGPESMSVTAALAIYQWLRQRRATTEDVRKLSGKFDLIEVLAAAPAPPSFDEPIPILPIQLWQDGALLFAAAQPSDPDLRLGMLQHAASDRWQWLPLTGPDFPIATYSQRGPVVAWTPHLSKVAVKLDHTPTTASTTVSPARRPWLLLLSLLMLVMLGVNAWVTWRVLERLDAPVAKAEPVRIETVRGNEPRLFAETDVESVALQLHRYLLDRGLFREFRESTLLQQYEKLNRHNDFFTVQSPEAKRALGAFVELSSRKSPAQIEALIRSTGQAAKGIDEEILHLIAQRVYQKLAE